MADTKFWLAVGTPENWHTAFDYGGIWGLRPSQRRYWESMNENHDIVFFYATSPISGVVGYGIVRTKLNQDSPLWPDERATNQIIWPLRFEFDVMSCLPPAAWPRQKAAFEELKSRVRGGFQYVESDLAKQIISALPSAVPQHLVTKPPVGPRSKDQRIEPALLPPTVDLHDQAQFQLAEIGRLQRYMVQTECPMENRRIDVVWRRVQRSVPSYVFEVQVSGNITDALGKLKQAYETWNSNIFLVGKEEHRRPVNESLVGMFHEIQPRLRFLELSQVQELYEKKRAYREFENELGILG